jgi:tetratricopeptide (TPR) repeat protein
MKNYNDHACLSLAKSSFEEALIVIRKLEILNDEEKCEEKEKNFRKRAIILCRGRCRANLGKTFFEQADSLMNSKSVPGSKQHAQRLLRQAIKYFRSAELDAQTLRARAIVDVPLERRTIEQKLDADKLEYFTNHLQAYAFLSLGRNDHCLSCIIKAAGISEDDRGTDMPKFLVEDSINISISKLYLMEDLYEAAFSAISIISFLLEEKYDAIRSSKKKETDYLFSTLCRAYDQAATMSSAIHQCSMQELREVVDMITSKEEMYTRKEILEFKTLDVDRYNEWNLNTTETKNPLSFDRGRRNIPLPRNDIFRNSIALSRSQPRGKFIIDDTMSSVKASGKKTGLVSKTVKDTLGGGDFDKFFSDNEPIDAISECDHDFVTYLKWGNELFEEQGLILNIYPNCEPPRPPEMNSNCRR